jgi:DNA-binding response OmpR family regulator
MNKRILIIDDEENIRRVVRLTLEAAGYEIGEAIDGVQGLEYFADGSSWDAVVLDQRMPGMDGLETLRNIKERNPNARVVMATAYASIELAVDAMKLGATDFVRKPMTPETLRNAIDAALSKNPTGNVEPVRDGSAKEEARPLIDTITMNGFHVLCPPNTIDYAGYFPDERRFLVKSPNGDEREVTVKIDDESIAYVERMTRRNLPVESSFWTERALRTLTDYLWSNADVPGTNTLRMEPIDRDDLDSAARWTDP